MRILLLGGNGQVGQALSRSLAPLGDLSIATRNGVFADGRACEIADFDRLETFYRLFKRLTPDIVVNAAAYTAVDHAESDAVSAFRINAEAPEVLASLCAESDALLVHYSTDYVFDGTASKPYIEDDPLAPLGVYGASKLAGEDAIRASKARYAIFRTAWVYASYGHNFLRTMLRLANAQPILHIVNDQTGTPTSANLIADVTARALRQGIRSAGLWHLTAAGQTTWYEFAEAIFLRAKNLGLIAKIPELVPIATEDYPTPALRPNYSVLDHSRLEAEFRLQLPGWKFGLEQVLGELSLP